MRNLEVQLKRYPNRMVTTEDFAVVETQLPDLQDREILVENTYISVDPYMLGRMSEADSYVEPFTLNTAMEGDAVGTVIASNHPDFVVGETVAHLLGWRKYAIINPDEWPQPGPDAVDQAAVLRRVDTRLAPASAYLGALGMTGLTAYAGIVYAGEVKNDDVVFVSGAAGAVGSLAGQIAKQRGCTVIGSAGSDEKVKFLCDELGFDAAFNYKTQSPANALPALAPEGISLYFDCVGGDHLEAALDNIRPWGRVVGCGYISSYESGEVPSGPPNYWPSMERNITIRGMLVPGYYDKWNNLYQDVGNLLKEGKIKSPQTLCGGLDNAVEAFLGLFSGANTGKMLVKVAA